MKQIIFILLLILSLFCGKLTTIDVHEAWVNYPSAEAGKEKYEIGFPDQKKLNKFNKENLETIKKDKLLYLERMAKKILTNKSVTAYTDVGVLYAQNSFYSNALYYFFKGIEVDIKSSTLYNNIANVYYITRNDKLATKYYRKALKYSRNNPITLLNLAFIHYETGDFKKAKKYYLIAVTIDPTIDRPEYKVIASEEDTIETKAANKGVSRLGLKWQK